MANRPGAVLIATVFTLLILAALGTGLLTAAVQAHRTVEARSQRLVARARAESAVAYALRDWHTRAWDDLPVGATRVLPRAHGMTTRVRRLASAIFLIRGEGTAGDGLMVVRAGAFVHTVQPGSIARALRAAITSGAAVDQHASVITSDSASQPAINGMDCPGSSDPPYTDADSIPPIAAIDSAAARARIGPFLLDSLAGFADHLESGTVTPAPQQKDRECNTDAAGNWGDPSNPGSPCADYHPLIVARGDLRVTAGAGQGMLVVLGDLTMQAGARFYGPVIVGGRTTLRNARIDGALRTAGVASIDASVVSYRACEVLRAVRGAPALNRVFRTGSRVWIPQF